VLLSFSTGGYELVYGSAADEGATGYGGHFGLHPQPWGTHRRVGGSEEHLVFTGPELKMRRRKPTQGSTAIVSARLAL